MAFTFVNSSYDQVAAGTSVSPSVVSGIQDNDIMFALLIFTGAKTPSGVPSGWSALGNDTGTRFYLYYKIASSESGSYTWSWSGAMNATVDIAAYRGGFDTADPIDAVSNTDYVLSNTNLRAAGFTVTDTDSPIVFCGGTQSGASRTFTPPTDLGGFNEDIDIGSGTSDIWLTFASTTWSSSGSTGNIDGTISASTVDKHAFAVSLNPYVGVNYDLVCGTGTFSYSGGALTFSKGYNLICNTGSFGYSGPEVVSFTSSRHMTCGTGTFSYSGSDLAFKKALNLVCDSGVFSYSGSALDFIVGIGYILNCETGTFSYTGSNLDFVKTLNLVCDGGTFSYSGSVTDLIKAHNYYFDLDGGIFSYTGGDILLNKGYNLICDTGVYAYSGASLTFNKALNLICDGGVFSYSGATIALSINDFVNLLIGGDGTYNYDGLVKNAVVFSACLGEREHNYFLNNYKALFDSASLILNSSSNCNQTTKILDKTTNINDVTKGDGSTSSTYPTYNSSEKSYTFDGVDDYIDDFLTLPSAYTVSIGKKVSGNIPTIEQVNDTTITDYLSTSGGFNGDLYNLVILPFVASDLEKYYLQYKQLYYRNNSCQRGQEYRLNDMGFCELAHYYENTSSPYDDFSVNGFSATDTNITVEDDGILFESADSNIEIASCDEIENEDITVVLSGDFRPGLSESYILEKENGLYITVTPYSGYEIVEVNGSICIFEQSINNTHLAIVIGNNRKPLFYVNGEYVDEGNLTITDLFDSSTGNSLFIGNNSATNTPFDGKLKRLHFYNKRLNSGDIKALYAQSKVFEV